MRKQTYPMLYWSYWDNITYEYCQVKSMLSKQVWDNIAQENYFRNVGLECTDILSLENRSHDLFFNGCIIIKHSWLFLFNVGSAVNLRLV